ncbi:MAG: tRNA (guanosine(46)-N7)-methyltransferase TrmB [Spartobacteria bacterium]|nr:tRNA (guanosine(46)-N7)-methyltransferase TrmB [Spartobacteria bacterium]
MESRNISNQSAPVSDPESRSRFIPEQWLTPFAISDLFVQPNHPLAIDLGCGKGRFLLEHAAAHPDINFLGIDRMLNRIRKIAKKVDKREMENVRLLRLDGFYTVSYLIPEHCVDIYYIFFPDPWPKKRHHHNRIFNDVFLDALYRTMKPRALLHFATDHLPYYDDVYDLLRHDAHFKQTATYEPPPEEKSDFELMFMDDKEIGRCSFEFVQ